MSKSELRLRRFGFCFHSLKNILLEQNDMIWYNVIEFDPENKEGLIDER